MALQDFRHFSPRLELASAIDADETLSHDSCYVNPLTKGKIEFLQGSRRLANDEPWLGIYYYSSRFLSGNRA